MIRLADLTIRNGTFALKGVQMEVPSNQYAVMMGPTGCGKTTLLEGICGLKPAVAGSIILDGRDVTRLKPSQREVAYVPQDGALFATMTVRDNLGFALKIRKWPTAAMETRVNELARMLRIGPLLDRMPDGLSGGEAQRVALGRALASKPRILCLDEPLNALDADTREEMYELLRSVQARSGVTALHVTHDRREAERLADLLFQFVNGAIRKV